MSIEDAAKSLNKAMKGIGTDESKIIKEICSHTNAQRQEIKNAYMTMFGKKLEDDLKSEISGHFLEGVLALLKPTIEYEAECIRSAMKGLGTDEALMIEILCTKEPHEIRHLAETYKRLYNRNFEEDVASEQGGDLGRVFKSLASGGRETTQVPDLNLASKEADELYKAGEGKLGTDEVELMRVLCSRSYVQLQATFEAYFKQHKSDIEKAIRRETSGLFEKALLTIIHSVRNKPLYYADELHKAMKGFGTNDNKLIRLLVCRCEIDLPQIKFEYKRKNNKSLYDAVKSELSGDYEKLFLGLIGKN